MDWEATGGKEGRGILTTAQTATSQLVGVVVDVSVMGIFQSGIILALARAQAELSCTILELMIRELAYADDLSTGVTTQEVADLQEEFWGSMDWAKLRKPCEDRVCCPVTRQYEDSYNNHGRSCDPICDITVVSEFQGSSNIYDIIFIYEFQCSFDIRDIGSVSEFQGSFTNRDISFISEFQDSPYGRANTGDDQKAGGAKVV